MLRSIAQVGARLAPVLAGAALAVFVWLKDDGAATLPASRSIQETSGAREQGNNTTLVSGIVPRAQDASTAAWRAALRMAQASGPAGLPLEEFEEQIAALPLDVVVALTTRRDVWRELPAYARRLAGRLAREAPARLAAWLDELGSGDPCHEPAAVLLIGAWTSSAPADALQWLTRIPDHRERAALVIVAAEALATHEPALAIDLLSALPATFDRDAALQKLFHDWAKRSPQAAFEAIPRATASHAAENTRAVLLEGVLIALRARAPAEAERLALLIPLRGAEPARAASASLR